MHTPMSAQERFAGYGSDSFEVQHEVIPEDLEERIDFAEVCFRQVAAWIPEIGLETVAASLSRMTAEAMQLWLDLIESRRDISLKISFFDSVLDLFQNCFAVYCKPIVEHQGTDPVVKPDLGGVCYMFWDNFCGLSDTAGQHVLNNAAVDTMTKILQMKHVTCVESALHGLNHWLFNEPTNPEEESIRRKALDAIDQYLASPDVDPRLIEYATGAKTGRLQ